MKTVWELQVIKYYQQYSELEKILIDNNDFFGALTHFRIARNFIGLRNQNSKDELVAIINTVILNETLSSRKKYIELLDKFKHRYKKQLLSATSKILWFMDSKNDYIIYDSLGEKSLTKLTGTIDGIGFEKYFKFCDKWTELFTENEIDIKQATLRVKDFYLNSPNFNDKNLDVMDTQWFRQRVFDMFLWRN
jgi:hypothetical protein